MLYKAIDKYDFVKEFDNCTGGEDFSEAGKALLYQYISNLGDKVVIDIVDICFNFIELTSREEFHKYYKGNIENYLAIEGEASVIIHRHRIKRNPEVL